MSLESKIATIVAAVAPDSHTYQLASTFRANLDSFHIESDELPFIVLDNELPKDAEIKQNFTVDKTTRVYMWFLDKDSPDNTEAVTNTIQQSMEEIADKTAAAIYQLQSVHPLNNQAYRIIPIFHAFNTDLSGVAMEMRVNYNQLIPCVTE